MCISVIFLAETNVDQVQLPAGFNVNVKIVIFSIYFSSSVK